jgi:hypothetical protein
MTKARREKEDFLVKLVDFTRRRTCFTTIWGEYTHPNHPFKYNSLKADVSCPVKNTPKTTQTKLAS